MRVDKFFLIIFSALLLSVSQPWWFSFSPAFGKSVVVAQAKTREEALRLYQLGNEQSSKNQYQTALDTFQKALVILREIGDRQGEAAILNKIGLVCRNLGQYPKALEFSQQALAISKQIGDKVWEGDTLNNIGVIYAKLGRYSTALEFYQQALTIHKQIGNKAGEGTNLNNIGVTYHRLGQYPKALEFCTQALAIRQQIVDKAGEGTTLHNIGGIYAELGQYPKALKFLQQALVISKQIGNKAGEGNTLDNIGTVYRHLGEYPKALEFLQQALVISKQIGNKDGEGNTLKNIGEVYRHLGEYPKALEFYQYALVISKQIGNKAGEGNTLKNIGTVYHDLGEYPKALEFYQYALVISKQIGNKDGEGHTLKNIGVVYYDLGEYFKAWEFYQQALKIYKQIGRKVGEGITLQGIGEVYDRLQEYPKALEFNQQALKIYKQIGTKAGEGSALNNIGLVYNSLRQYSKALEFHQKALAIRKEMGDKDGEGTTLNNLGYLYGSLGKYRQALDSFQQALAIRRQIGDKSGQRTTVSNIGYILLKSGNFKEATETLSGAIEIGESLRPGLKDSDKVSIIDTQINSYKFLQQALIAQNQTEATEAALEISERSRARAFVDLLSSRLKSETSTKTQVPNIKQLKQIAKEQQAAIVEYSIINEELTREDKKQWQESQLYIWVINPTGEVNFRKIDIKQFFKEKNTDLASLEEIVENTRDSIGVGDRNLFTRTNSTTQNSTTKRDQFQITTFPSPDDDPSKYLKQLHQILIEPIADLLPTNPNERVIFIPQDELFLVPFPALLDQKGKYLIEKHTILTAPSIQVLELTRQQKQKIQASPASETLIVGNPTMPSVSPNIVDEPQKLADLPGAKLEADAIAKLLGTKALTGDAANKAAVLSRIPQAKIIHLATHGILNNFQALKSAIALAPTGKDDGLLTAEEILNFKQKLNADLVVLSACDTGRGRITGDGVIGLSRSLFIAGTPSVIVSLWAVPDAPTAELMTEFYKNLYKKKNRLDKAQALRIAMLKMKDKYSDSPRKWAAFTLIGESE